MDQPTTTDTSWDRPQLKRNERTGEIGYWTGSEMIILPPRMASDSKGAQALIDKLAREPNQPQFPKQANGAPGMDQAEQDAIQKIWTSTRPKVATAPTARDPQEMPELPPWSRPIDRLMKSAEHVKRSMNPFEGMIGSDVGGYDAFKAEQKRQRGMTGGEVAKEAALTVLGSVPAFIGGAGVGALLPKAVSRTAAFLNRLATGAGATGGEWLGQQAGISPDSLTNLAIAGAGGFAGGRVERGARTGPEKKAQKIAFAEPTHQSEIASKAKYREKLTESLAKPDVTSQKIIQPIEDVIIRERGKRPMPMTPGPHVPETNSRIGIINDLADISSNLGNLMRVFVKPVAGVPLPKGPPTPTGAPAGTARVTSPQRTAIPGPGGLASEAAIPSMPGKQQQQQVSWGTPATQTNTPQSIAPGGLQVTGISVTDSAQTVVEEVKRLAGLRERARSIGAHDLAHDIDGALTKVRKTIGYEEAAPHWAQGKGYEESKINTRGSSAVAREMNRFEGRRATTFTEEEKRRLIKQAAGSEQMSKVLQWMMLNPTGQKLLRAGVMPNGTIKPGVIHAGSQLMGHAWSREGE